MILLRKQIYILKVVFNIRTINQFQEKYLEKVFHKDSEFQI
jgi:hypothetical protein